MPSRAEFAKLELVLRTVALAALVAWIANALRPSLAHTETASEESLRESLPRWSRSAALDRAHVRLDTVPDATTTAWLAALPRAGTAVSWSAGDIPDVGIETYSATDPAGGVFILTSAPASRDRVLSDALGPIDTLATSSAPAVSRIAATEGRVTLTSGAQPARASVGASVAPKRLFVTGAAGWEAKFVIAALEESGWTVDAHLIVSPDHDVWQGPRGAALDTARYAAAVLLDSATAESARAVEQFAASGGGVVIAGDANRARRVASLIAWRAGARESAPLGTLAADTSWRGLSVHALDTVPGKRAIALERRGRRTVVAVRRHEAGRVAGVGYDQTWRWRMAGGDSGRVAHRDWWSRVVGSVAARPALSADLATGAAPLASLVEALGPASPQTASRAATLDRGLLSNLLGALALAALLAEWVLRRRRGAR